LAEIFSPETTLIYHPH